MNEVSHHDIWERLGRLTGNVEGLTQQVAEHHQESRAYRAKNVERLAALEQAVQQRQARERAMRLLLAAAVPITGIIGWFHDKILIVFK